MSVGWKVVPRLRILLAEDDANDRKLLGLALAEARIPADVVVVKDGQEVLDYLQREGKFAGRSEVEFPDLVVVDLKMLGIDGLDVLKWVRSHPGWSALPVVLLSGSGLEEDVERAYRLGANSYFQKPNSVAELAALLRAVAEYWQLTRRPASSGGSR